MPQTTERFVINGDGTVTDTSTGLMWQQETQEKEDFMNWESAIIYCKLLTLAGYTDWRLPDMNELLSIMDFTGTRPAINRLIFPHTMSAGYWSCVGYIGSEYKQLLNFGPCKIASFPQPHLTSWPQCHQTGLSPCSFRPCHGHKFEHHYVRAVRGREEK